MKRSENVMFFNLACGLLVLIMLGPIIAMLAAVPPSVAIHAFSQSAGRDALRVSLIASSIAVAAATILGVPAGYALAHSESRARAIVLALLALPLAFPPVASGIMLLQTVGTQTVLGAWLAAHGVQLVDSLWGVALAEFFVAGSFVPIVACAAFATLDRSYEEAAQMLGAGRFAIFWRVALPLAAPNIVAGILLAWLRAIGEYGATSIVAYHPTALPVQLYVTLSAQGVGPALALSYGFVVLAAIIIALQWTLRRRVV